MIIEDLAALAEAVGFRTTNVIAAGMTMPYEIPARQIGRFIAGSGQGFYGCFRHQLLLPRPYLVLTKPLRLDIQCQRGASVKIGWKYLDD